MTNHEKGCTMNPERICGMCKVAGYEQKPIPELKSVLLSHKDPEAGMIALRTVTDNCPACILAVIRQITAIWDFEDYMNGGGWEFDYKQENSAFWTEHPRNEEIKRWR